MNEVETPPRVAAFLGRRHGLLIGNERVSSDRGKTIEIINPSTAEPIAAVPAAEIEDVDAAVAAARAAFEDGAWSLASADGRARLMFRLAELIERDREELSFLESLNNGRPISETRAGDIPHCASVLRYFAGWATKIEGRTISLGGRDDFHAYSLREPVGVSALITPWNFPLPIVIAKLAPALAAGCTAVIKPAESTPLTTLWLADLIAEAGFPTGVVNVVTGFGAAAGAHLSAHDGVDKLSFTGSTTTGKKIVEAATGNLKKLSLELGGKSPVVIFPDCDLDQAIEGAARAIFFNSGQCCTAGSRLYVHRKVYDRVVEGLCDFARRLRIGPGLDPSTELGPIISAAQTDRVMHYVEDAIAKGAQPVLGGRRLETRGYFVEPTIFASAKPEMKARREEVFGPVLCMEPFEDDGIELAAALANDSEYGLSAGIWTKNLSTAHRLARRIRAGTVWINCHNVDAPNLPTGGYRQSGWGREMGWEAIEDFTEVKSVVAAL